MLSTNFIILHLADDRDKAFMHMINKKADRTYPCGDPVLMKTVDETSVDIVVYWLKIRTLIVRVEQGH